MFSFKDIKDIPLQDYIDTWRTGYYTDPDTKNVYEVSMEDALAHPNSTQFFQITVETLVREAVEPALVATRLLTRVNYKPGMTVSFPSIGAIVADDVNEAGEYPEYSLNFGSGAQIITIGKAGLAIKFTDEMKRYNQYDVLNYYLRAMGRALARHKEKKFFAMLSHMGIVTHDNVNPSQSVFGVTRGLSLSGTPNGALIADDIYEAYGQLLMNGFTPNALLVHPLTFTMFLSDPVLRAFAINHGGGVWFNGWNGNAAAQYPWPRGQMGKMGPGPQKVTSSTDPKTIGDIEATMRIPDYFGLPLTIIVSPAVPYNHATKLTNIYLVDTENIGALIVDEEPTMEEIPDRMRDITKIKIRERYALAPFNEGNAVAILKNVKVTPNELLLPTVAAAVNVNAIDRSNPAV